MSGSHSVDHLTYTYYTGEDQCIIQGPNCYKCMNELFHAKDLGGVVLFYICTPTRIIPFTLHSLIFVNGSDSPFTMKTIPENIFKQNCVSCVQRTTKQMPGHDHIANQAVLKTQPLTEKLPPAPTTCEERCQDIVRSDTISSSGTREECDRWHSLGDSETPRNLSKVCKAISHPRIPFVTKDYTRFDGMLFEKIFNYLSFLKHSELLDDGFSDHLFYIYPKMKNIRRCSLCNVSISCNQHADRYLDHFLSSKHIAKAVEKQWQLTFDYTVFLRVLESYLDKSGRTAEKSSLKAMLKEAASKKIFSCEREEYNHLYKKRA